MLAGKAWGITRLIESNSSLEFHRIEAKAGTQCSKHTHESKWNGFYVESGKLVVAVWKNSYALVDRTTLGPGDYTKVCPGEFHRFEALEDTVCFELYWSALDPNDIKREDTGGPIGQA